MNEIIFEATDGLSTEVAKTTVSSTELAGILEGIAAEVETMVTDDVAKVKNTRIRLGKIRNAITKQSKAQRDGFIAAQKTNIAIEKSLIAIIEPQESRLKALEDEAAKAKERAARVAVLPMRHDMLNKIGDGVEVADEVILDMDNDSFIGYYNVRLMAKNEADRIAIDAEKMKLARDAEDRKIAEEAALKERERMENQQRLENEAKERTAALLEKQKAEEEKKREADSRYQAWLTKIGYDKNTWYLAMTGNIVKAYKFVDSHDTTR